MDEQRLGFDIDGLLADFGPAYMRLLIEVSGRDLFAVTDWIDQPCWDWDKMRGYTNAERSMAWDAIRQSPDFWFNLSFLPPVVDLRRHWRELNDTHEVYFITSRVGSRVRMQTEDWLRQYLSVATLPTVLVVGHGVKGVVARALNLDVYVDDNYDNVLDCVQDAPKTRTYLYDREYNHPSAVGSTAIREVEDRRVSSLSEVLLRREHLVPMMEIATA